ncbi:MAG: hypothetical protein IKX88_13595 [Thermoguttaceae bacterium]|nr:hypothetical protein [Thermoguttaceae bacterium]
MKNDKIALFGKFYVVLCMIACFTLTACDGDVSFVVPFEDETPPEVALLNELQTLQTDEKTNKNDASNPALPEAVQVASKMRQLAAISPFDYVPANFKESFLKDNKISLKELMQIGEYFRCLRDTAVEPTRFILIDGTPVPLENGMDLSRRRQL